MSRHIPDINRKPIQRVILERLTTPRHILIEQARRASRKGERKEAGVRRKPREIKGRYVEDRLRGAHFPIKTREQLVSELGGKGVKVEIRGGPAMSSEEIAERCFAEKNHFFAPGEVHHAVDISSWARTTTKSFNGAIFPIKGSGQVMRRIGHVEIDGVTIGELAGSIKYPLVSVTDLIDKLVKARKRKKG